MPMARARLVCLRVPVINHTRHRDASGVSHDELGTFPIQPTRGRVCTWEAGKPRVGNIPFHSSCASLFLSVFVHTLRPASLLALLPSSAQLPNTASAPPASCARRGGHTKEPSRRRLERRHLNPLYTQSYHTVIQHKQTVRTRTLISPLCRSPSHPPPRPCTAPRNPSRHVPPQSPRATAIQPTTVAPPG